MKNTMTYQYIKAIRCHNARKKHSWRVLTTSRRDQVSAGKQQLAVAEDAEDRVQLRRAARAGENRFKRGRLEPTPRRPARTPRLYTGKIAMTADTKFQTFISATGRNKAGPRGKARMTNASRQRQL